MDRSGIRRLAVVGLAKNVGKTVAFNTLVRQAVRHGRRVGMVSAGRDGEDRDAVFSWPKPAVPVPAGALVVTVDSRLQGACGGGDAWGGKGIRRGEGGCAGEDRYRSADPAWEILTGLGHATVLGAPVLARARRQIAVELVAPGGRQAVASAVQAMLQAGAQLVLVDGAVNRVASAHPEVADGVVLAVGAAAAPAGEAGLAGLLEAAAWQAELFRLPALSAPEGVAGRKTPAETEHLRRFFGTCPLFSPQPGGTVAACWVFPDEAGGAGTMVREWRAPTTFDLAEELADAAAHAAVQAPAQPPGWRQITGTAGGRGSRQDVILAVSGAVHDGLVQALARRGVRGLLVAADPSRILASPVACRRFVAQGGRLAVWKRPSLLAVTVNPFNPGGRSFPAGFFFEAVARAVRPVPAFDLVADLVSAGGTGQDRDPSEPGNEGLAWA